MSVLTVDKLNFSYPDKKILNDLSFAVDEGDFLCVVGTNGTGKSTLLKLILGFLAPDSGSIQIEGVPNDKFKNHGDIAYVSQKATAFNRDFPATAEEIVGLGLSGRLSLFKKLNAANKAQVAEALERVGMSGYAKKLIGRLSGGQQQRVFIARALVSQPRILFLDEPTVGIDAEAVDSICCLLGELNKNGLTIVMVTHDISSTIYHADKVLKISENGCGTLVSAHDYIADFRFAHDRGSEHGNI